MRIRRNDSEEAVALKEAINKLMLEMRSFSGEDKEYAQMVKQLQKLFGLLDQNKVKGPSADTLAIIGGNALIALLVVAYESKNVVTSKVHSFIMKTR